MAMIVAHGTLMGFEHDTTRRAVAYESDALSIGAGISYIPGGAILLRDTLYVALQIHQTHVLLFFFMQKMFAVRLRVASIFRSVVAFDEPYLNLTPPF